MENAEEVVDIPVGFDTDFDSTPAWAKVLFWFLLIGRKKGRRAATLHDYGYRYNHNGRGQAWWDYQYYVAMIAEGVPERTARIMYSGVHARGHKTWNKYRQLEKK